MEKRSVLVTGAGGFTGRYVVEAFERAGYTVFQWRREEGLQEVDLCDVESIREGLSTIEPDIVVHLAAISFVAHADVDEMYRVNLIGTRNLLAALAAKRARPSRVILAGTASIYGNVEGVVSEDFSANPQNDYGVSKLAMEYAAKLWTDALNITVLRLFNYTGLGQSERFLIPKIVAHFKNRSPVLELGNIDVMRDFNDVRNVAQVYVDLAEGGDRWEILNVCTGQEHSIRSILELLSGMANFMPEIRINSEFVRANDVKRLVGNPNQLHRRLGSEPEFSMEGTLNWMLKN